MLDFRLQPLLGLDIQDHEIRLVQLQGSQKKKSVQLAVCCELPVGSVTEGKIHDPERVSDCLQKLVQDHHLKKPDVAIALPMHSVVVQHISIIKGLHESEMEAEVMNHLNSLSSVSGDLCYDYGIAGSIDDQHYDLLLVAAASYHLNSLTMMVQGAGLKVRVADVDSFALERAHQFIKKNNFYIDEKWLISLGLALRGVYRWLK